MTIRQKTLDNHGEKHTILIKGDQMLNDALQRLKEKNSPENSTYLVVSQPDQTYQVILFSEIKDVFQKMGPYCLSQSLSALPIPMASEVVPKNTAESGKVVVDRIASQPRSTVVITDEQGFVGLFANPNRSGDKGLFGGLSLLELHGEMVQLTQDARSDFTTNIQPPTCPHCDNQGFYNFSPDQRAYLCPNCDNVVEQP